MSMHTRATNNIIKDDHEYRFSQFSKIKLSSEVVHVNLIITYGQNQNAKILCHFLFCYEIVFQRSLIIKWHGSRSKYKYFDYYGKVGPSWSKRGSFLGQLIITAYRRLHFWLKCVTYLVSSFLSQSKLH